MTPAKITFVGGGNMAQAMIAGLVASKAYRAKDIVVIEPDRKARARVRKLGANAYDKANPDLAPGPLLVLGVKPQSMKAACAQWAAILATHRDTLVLSIAAGIRLDSLSQWLGGHSRVVRCMPNTPALIRSGISAVFAWPDVTGAQKRLAGKVLASVGTVVWLDNEALLDPVTAVSGSGPAYVFWLIEQLAASGRGLGLPEAAAGKLAVETVLGAARLAAQSKDPAAVLRERVTSKGGTTEAALRVFAEEDLAARFDRAVRAASRRGTELGRLLDEA